MRGGFVQQHPLVFKYRHGATDSFVVVPETFTETVFGNRRYRRSRFVRAYLYRRGVIRAYCGNYEYHRDPTRAHVDALFRAALEAEGCSWLIRTILWLWVRASGWSTWRLNASKIS